jgi:acyl carrier protein
LEELVEDQIRSILAEYAKLPEDPSLLKDDDDLFKAGMTSHASVNVMLALEDEFDIEFPESMLRKSTFETIGAMRAAVSQLTGSLK